jgi:hypothetical protein
MPMSHSHPTVRTAGPHAIRRSPRRLKRLARALLAIPLLVVAGQAMAAAGRPDWNQVDNIKEAATHLAQMQRTQGATRAFAFIEACYKTHSLSSNYTKAFEACIAQDYLETQILALIYSRMPPETLKKMGAPSPEVLARTMGKRVAAAFATYDVPVDRVKAFKKLVDEHGFPVFFKALFPGVDMPVPKDGLPSKDENKKKQ